MTVSFSLSYAVLWGLVIFQSLVLLGLVRTVFELKNRPAGIDDEHDDLEDLKGTPAPSFRSMAVFGGEVDSAELGDQLTALLFVSAECPTCAATFNQLEGLKMKTEGRVVVVCRSGREACRRVAQSYGLTVPVISDEDETISRLFGAPVVPAAVLVERGHIVSVGHPVMEDALQKMVDAQLAPEVEVESVGQDGAGR